MKTRQEEKEKNLLGVEDVRKKKKTVPRSVVGDRVTHDKQKNIIKLNYIRE